MGFVVTREKHFIKFEDHTLVKHALLKAYLKRWATILTGGQARSAFQTVWFVDAFAGAGSDREGNPGSPVLAATIAQAINESLGRDAVRVLAIEQHEKRCAELKSALSSFPAVVVRNGTLEDRIDRFLSFTSNAPTLFFLDPFGLDGLDNSVMRRALRGKHNEIFALFTDEGAVRLRGKANAQPPTTAPAKQVSLFYGSDYEAADAERSRREVENCLRGHKSSPHAKQILDRVFGSSLWEDQIAQTPVKGRQRRFTELFEQMLKDIGASYVLRFNIETSAGRHKYFLMHASKSPSAFRAMKEAISATRKQQCAAAMKPQSLFTVVSLDQQNLVAELRRAFAGRTVRWTEGGDRSEVSVKGYLLYQTQLCPDEFEGVKQTLHDTGLTVSEKGKDLRPLRFTFP